ncbi:MAG: Fe-S-containing hydro-lyase [Eubacteriales bacterium]|nr:Fe-S-containing hydro-lyase [Clostridiales bacterium]MDY5836269.1 Fe-S-containing hydro-lyase [Eubacteriales bacterium]
MEYHLTAPMSLEDSKKLRVGDRVYLSGTIYTGRDAAHKRFVEALDRGEDLPFPVEGSVIFFVGPSPAAPGQVIGACGPTSSYRMDAFSPRLLALGQRAMIGKGKRSPEVIQAMQDHGAVYLAAVGGAGALLAGCVKSAEVIAYEDLGAEAVRKLQVESMPLLVVIDSQGHNLYESGPAAWRAEHGYA